MSKEKNIDSAINTAMIEAFNKHFLGGQQLNNSSIMRGQNGFFHKIANAVRTMSHSSYWTKANTVEAWGFATKLAIIFPGLLFGRQWWWLYIFAILSSVALIWSSTVKTLPTIILFNVMWVVLASTAILKHFL